MVLSLFIATFANKSDPAPTGHNHYITINKQKTMDKKNLFTATAGLMLMTSCHVTQKATSSSAIEGEWNIMRIENSPIKAQPYPYIGFDTQENRIYGNSSCNLLSGSFNFKKNKGKIELGQMASTMMACPNMKLEQDVLRALNQVERIISTDKEHLVLCDKNKKPLIELEKRFRVVPLADIKGEWRIVNVFGEKMPATEEVPTANFDIDNSRISAYAGCNRLSATFKNGEKPNAITVSQVMSTRMACPDMTTEQHVISALEQTRSYGISQNGNLLLFSAGGNLVMELMRHK